jgi:hypothetical protein
MARITADRPDSHCATVAAIVAPLKRNFTARRRRSFNTTRGSLCASVFSMTMRRFSRIECLTHSGRISKSHFSERAQPPEFWVERNLRGPGGLASTAHSFRGGSNRLDIHNLLTRKEIFISGDNTFDMRSQLADDRRRKGELAFICHALRRCPPYRNRARP